MFYKLYLNVKIIYFVEFYLSIYLFIYYHYYYYWKIKIFFIYQINHYTSVQPKLGAPQNLFALIWKHDPLSKKSFCTPLFMCIGERKDQRRIRKRQAKLKLYNRG